MRAVAGLLVAARYLTVVPLGRGSVRDGDPGRSAAWFPVVGLGIGLAVLAGERIAVEIFPVLLAALLAVTVWKLLTGGLHLDGLADCLDGLAGEDATQRIGIMRDSRIGTFGVVGLILFLLLEVVAVAELPPPLRGRTLLVAPAVGRVMPPLLARWFPAARPEGQGAAFSASVPPWAVPVALATAAVVALAVLGPIGLAALAAAAVIALAFARFMARRLGGVTGDVLGAAVETAELTVLLTVLAWAQGRR